MQTGYHNQLLWHFTSTFSTWSFASVWCFSLTAHLVVSANKWALQVSLAALSTCQFWISTKDNNWAVLWTHFEAGVEASTNENGLFLSFWVCLMLNMKYPVNNVYISQWMNWAHITVLRYAMWLHYQKEEIQTLKFYCIQSRDSGTSLQDIK